MSLFRTKEVWTYVPEDEEIFDQYSMVVSNLNSRSDFIIIGSHKGVLRIFNPILEIDGNELKTGYKPNDLVLEKVFSEPILQLETGQLVSGSSSTHLAILSPKTIGVYCLIIKEGKAEHGTQSFLKLMYEHKLKRSSANFTIGHFGGTLNRDFICVQSLDGLLSFYEQESFNFCCFISVFLLPGPITYIRKTDSFITVSSNWCIECFQYKNLYEAGRNSVEDINAGKSVIADWSFNLNEFVLDLKVLETSNQETFVLILGEKHLCCLSFNGKIKFMKRLEYSPICFTSYLVEDNIMTLIVSEVATLLIYKYTTLKWSAKLHFLPVSIRRANLWNLKGSLFCLNEEGKLECFYLGTQPSLFIAPPLNFKPLDYEKTEEELINLSKIMQDLNNDGKIKTEFAEKQMNFNLKFNSALESCSHEHNIANDLNNQMCSLFIELIPQGIFEELQISIKVEYPLKCVPQSIFYTRLTEKKIEKCDIFIHQDGFLPSLLCEVILTFILDSGVPRTLSKTIMIPFNLVIEACPPQKEAEHKITLNVNKEPVPTAVLFADLVNEIPSLLANGGSVGLKFIVDEVQKVTVLLAKSSQRYRIQSDSFFSLSIIIEQMIYRLNKHFKQDNDFAISFNGSFPILPINKSIEKHFELKQKETSLQNKISQLSSQYRWIEKHLIAKLKAKNPVPLTELEFLLDDSFKDLLKFSESRIKNENELKKSQNELSCCLYLIKKLAGLKEWDKEFIPIIDSVFESSIHEIDSQSWDDVMNANLLYLTKTYLAKSDKDKLKVSQVAFNELKDVKKLQKHFANILERISKNIPIQETHLTIKEEEVSPRDNNLPVGTELGQSSSRVLSAKPRAVHQMVQDVEESV